jgi:hypothetical protein
MVLLNVINLAFSQTVCLDFSLDFGRVTMPILTHPSKGFGVRFVGKALPPQSPSSEWA